jgi:TnpA family transposase
MSPGDAKPDRRGAGRGVRDQRVTQLGADQRLQLNVDLGALAVAVTQNALAAALKEYGALRRTIYAARYLADPAYRRKIFGVE